MVYEVRRSAYWPGMVIKRIEVGNIGHTLITTTRASIIQLTIHYWNLPILEYHTLLPQMAIMKRHTTERSQIVCIDSRLSNCAKQYTKSITDDIVAAKPSCVSSIMQWQHGKFVLNADGSLSLNPFSVDGRQLESAPCTADTATYTRYNQSETMEVCLCHYLLSLLSICENANASRLLTV